MRKRSVRIEEQYAVLIGGYKDMDSASADLKRIKKLAAPKSVPGTAIYKVDLAEVAAGRKADPKEEKFSFFRTSFVTPNPTVPATAANANKSDPFLKVLNADEPFSLLKCKRPWTLAVKEFYGATVIQAADPAPSGFLDKLFGSKPGAQLNASAMNAHNMAEALRNPKIGLEAYVLHTRTCSIVTVGGFDGPKDPRMEQVVQALARSFQITTGNPQLDQGVLSQPRPMEVPRF
jgi:hypothetical protein